MHTVIIVQARLGSTRLPGKILMEAAGKPLLEHVVERLRRIRNADRVVIATTGNPKDAPILALCERIGADFFIGSESDVLGRFHGAAKRFGADNIVRINSDCPLIDPAISQKVIQYYLDNRGSLDYAANILADSYPIGMHTEIFPFRVLEEAHLKAVDPVERENVTPYIYRNPGSFRLGSVVDDRNLSHHRWTLDYPEDYELIKRVYDALYPSRPGFGMDDVLDLLERHPDWAALNGHLKKQQTV